jgi:hypothetical protein
VAGTEAGSVVASYLLLRKAIGWIGTLLPVVLIVGDAAFTSTPLPVSLSDYYYTPMRNIFVGSLCVLGVFLVLYDVGVLADRWITNVAGVGALGVAFLAGSPEVPHLSTTQEVVGDLHVFFASVAFLAFSVTMWRFARADSDGPDAPAPSPGEANFYRVSAGVMLGFVILSGLAILLPISFQHATLLLFDFEALAIITFGVSWLVKGRALRSLPSAPGMRLIRSFGEGARSAAAPEELPR